MSIAWYDYVGTFGVFLILLAYFLLQTQRTTSASLSYSVLNLLGALLITVSLVFDFNFSAFVIEVFWILLSLYGIARWMRARRAPEKSG